MAPRRWYRLHWVTWLGLGLVGGVLVWCQFEERVVGFFGNNSAWKTWSQFGWPLICVSDQTTYRLNRAGKTIPIDQQATYRPPAILANVFCGVTAVACTVRVLESWLRSKNRFQFRLGSLFALVTVVAALTAFLTAEQGLISLAVSNFETSDEPRPPDWLCRTLGVDYFSNVSQVILPRHTTDSVFAQIDMLSRIQWLTLAESQITDAGLEHLRQQKDLEVLHLFETNITDAGVAHLSELADLQRLSLNDTRITDAGLAHLRNLTRLERLYLAGTKITDAACEELRHLTNLEYLDVRDTQITDAGCARLEAALPKCDVLHRFPPRQWEQE